MPTSGTRNDLYSSFKFLLELEGVVVGGFLEVGGLSIEADPIEYRSGDEDITVGKLSRVKRVTTITLKRGIMDSELWSEWFNKAMADQAERWDGSIVLQRKNCEEVLGWNLRGAWPVKLEGPDLKDDANEIVIESLEICHEGLEPTDASEFVRPIY